MVTGSGFAAGYGGGLYGSYSSATTVVNSILWGNVPDQLRPLSNEATSSDITVTYSDVQGGYGGPGNIALPPEWVDPAGADLRLKGISPCIEAGDPAGVPLVAVGGCQQPAGAAHLVRPDDDVYCSLPVGFDLQAVTAVRFVAAPLVVAASL